MFNQTFQLENDSGHEKNQINMNIDSDAWKFIYWWIIDEFSYRHLMKFLKSISYHEMIESDSNFKIRYKTLFYIILFYSYILNQASGS